MKHFLLCAACRGWRYGAGSAPRFRGVEPRATPRGWRGRAGRRGVTRGEIDTVRDGSIDPPAAAPIVRTLTDARDSHHRAQPSQHMNNAVRVVTARIPASKRHAVGEV